MSKMSLRTTNPHYTYTVRFGHETTPKCVMLFLTGGLQLNLYPKRKRTHALQEEKKKEVFDLWKVGCLILRSALGLEFLIFHEVKSSSPPFPHPGTWGISLIDTLIVLATVYYTVINS